MKTGLNIMNLCRTGIFLMALIAIQLFEDSAFETWSFHDGEDTVENLFYNHLHGYGIHLDGPRRISFPNTRVSDFPQEVYSGEHTLRLSNQNFKKGWLLTGKVILGHLIGIRSWERIPADMRFKSITWIGGGNGSTAGISIDPSGEFIEADPSFGLGIYDIAFEIPHFNENAL